MKHTRGPWKFELYGAHPEDAIAGQIDGPRQQHIADLPQYGPDSHVTRQQLEGNARLIAAAPEMLDFIRRYAGASTLGPYGNEARALLARIGG